MDILLVSKDEEILSESPSGEYALGGIMRDGDCVLLVMHISDRVAQMHGKPPEPGMPTVDIWVLSKHDLDPLIAFLEKAKLAL